jgi:hypothetical protein
MQGRQRSGSGNQGQDVLAHVISGQWKEFF